MLKKYFPLASAASLAGAVAWISASTACGGTSDDTTVTPKDGGGTTSSGGETGASSSSSSSGSGTSSSGGGDGGNPVVGKDPNTVPGSKVTYGKCPAFTKCDGDIKGQWEVSGGCLPDTTFDSFKTYCAGLVVHDVTIKASGTLGIDATNVIRDTSIFVDAKVDIDKSNCAALALAGNCGGIAALLKSGQGGTKFDDADCKDSETSCLCSAQATIPEKTTDKYKVDGAGTLTTTGTAERTYDYCPKGGTSVTYKETTAKNPTFGMFIEIKKK